MDAKNTYFIYLFMGVLPLNPYTRGLLVPFKPLYTPDET
jgi:hypothetical protein